MVDQRDLFRKVNFACEMNKNYKNGFQLKHEEEKRDLAFELIKNWEFLEKHVNTFDFETKNNLNGKIENLLPVFVEYRKNTAIKEDDYIKIPKKEIPNKISNLKKNLNMNSLVIDDKLHENNRSSSSPKFESNKDALIYNNLNKKNISNERKKNFKISTMKNSSLDFNVNLQKRIETKSLMSKSQSAIFKTKINKNFQLIPDFIHYKNKLPTVITTINPPHVNRKNKNIFNKSNILPNQKNNEIFTRCELNLMLNNTAIKGLNQKKQFLNVFDILIQNQCKISQINIKNEKIQDKKIIHKLNAVKSNNTISFRLSLNN